MKSNKSAYINVIFSIIGVIFNMIIPIVVFPYVTRVLGVEGIGKYSFYSSILSYLALFTGFGISLYGAREIGRLTNDIQKRTQAFVELIIINLILVAVSAILVGYLAFYSTYSDDCTIILLFSITLLTNAIGAEWLFVGIEMQGFMLLRNIVFKVLSTIMIFLVVTKPEHLIRYVAIVTFSQAGVAFTNIYYWIKFSNFGIVKSLSLKKYLKPLFSIFSVEVLLRYLTLGDVVILGILAGDKVVGIYSMGLKVFLLVSSILKVTSTTLMPRSAYYLENDNKEGFYCLLKNTIRMLFLIGLPISACLFVFAEPIILILGGEHFYESISLMKELSLFLMLCVLINTYVFQVLYPQNKIKVVVLSHLLGVLVNVILNFLLIPHMSYHGTYIAFAVSNLTILGVLFIREGTLLKSVCNKKDCYNYILATIGSIVIVYMSFVIIPNILWVVCLILFCVTYVVLLQVLKDEMFINIRKFVIQKLR